MFIGLFDCLPVCLLMLLLLLSLLSVVMICSLEKNTTHIFLVLISLLLFEK